MESIEHRPHTKTDIVTLSPEVQNTPSESEVPRVPGPETANRYDARTCENLSPKRIDDGKGNYYYAMATYAIPKNEPDSNIVSPLDGPATIKRDSVLQNRSGRVALPSVSTILNSATYTNYVDEVGETRYSGEQTKYANLNTPEEDKQNDLDTNNMKPGPVLRPTFSFSDDGAREPSGDSSDLTISPRQEIEELNTNFKSRENGSRPSATQKLNNCDFGETSVAATRSNANFMVRTPQSQDFSSPRKHERKSSLDSLMKAALTVENDHCERINNFYQSKLAEILELKNEATNLINSWPVTNAYNSDLNNRKHSLQEGSMNMVTDHLQLNNHLLLADVPLNHLSSLQKFCNMLASNVQELIDLKKRIDFEGMSNNDANVDPRQQASNVINHSSKNVIKRTTSQRTRLPSVGELTSQIPVSNSNQEWEGNYVENSSKINVEKYNTHKSKVQAPKRVLSHSGRDDDTPMILNDINRNWSSNRSSSGSYNQSSDNNVNQYDSRMKISVDKKCNAPAFNKFRHQMPARILQPGEIVTFNRGGNKFVVPQTLNSNEIRRNSISDPVSYSSSSTARYANDRAQYNTGHSNNYRVHVRVAHPSVPVLQTPRDDVQYGRAPGNPRNINSEYPIPHDSSSSSLAMGFHKNGKPVVVTAETQPDGRPVKRRRKRNSAPNLTEVHYQFPPGYKYETQSKEGQSKAEAYNQRSSSNVALAYATPSLRHAIATFRRGKETIVTTIPTTLCKHCGEFSTPEWRRGPYGNRTLCNACGLFYRKLVKKFGERRANLFLRFKKQMAADDRRVPAVVDVPRDVIAKYDADETLDENYNTIEKRTGH